LRQRLGLAAPRLGDPRVLVLDEPANGLDPEGIRWLRSFLRHLAGEGRTVLVSSHVLSEVQQTVDDVVIIARGRLVHASSLAELAASSVRAVRAASPDQAALLAALRDAGLAVAALDGHVQVEDATPAEVGRVAFAAGVELHELRSLDEGLEQTFLRLVGNGSVSTGAQDEALIDGVHSVHTEEGAAR
jgi:ABC-2 type transport system ATP-binding protein